MSSQIDRKTCGHKYGAQFGCAECVRDVRARFPEFPLQNDRQANPGPTQVPWPVAEKAWAAYSQKYGRDQSVERLAERGGFSWGEMDAFFPGWRGAVDAWRLLVTEREHWKDKALQAEKTLATAEAHLEAERLNARGHAGESALWRKRAEKAESEIEAERRENGRLRAALESATWGSEQQRLDAESKGLRRMLWMRHGCSVSALYGDDGEMQCSRCGIDFKRAPVEAIDAAFQAAGLAQMAMCDPRPCSWPGCPRCFPDEAARRRQVPGPQDPPHGSHVGSCAICKSRCRFAPQESAR